MTNYQLNRYEMYGSVIDYLKKNDQIWVEFPGYFKKYEEFCRHYGEITKQKEIQTKYAHKKSYEKKEIRALLEEKINMIARRMQAYALLEGNHTLLANCKISPWELSRKKQYDLYIFGANLEKFANEYIGKLVEYGITPEMISNLKDLTDAYNLALPDPRIDQVTSGVATKTIGQEFKNADKVLEFLDIVARINGESDAGFYSMYKTMRKQVKKGSVKMALKVNAIDEVTRLPVTNVVFTLTHRTVEKRKSKNKFQIVKKTKQLGGFKVMHLPPGIYDAVGRKYGYRDADTDILIDPTKLAKVVVEMEKR
jgi:hypothetical protein